MTHVTCRLTARTGISSGTLRSVIEYGRPLPFLINYSVHNTWYLALLWSPVVSLTVSPATTCGLVRFSRGHNSRLESLYEMLLPDFHVRRHYTDDRPQWVGRGNMTKYDDPRLKMSHVGHKTIRYGLAFGIWDRRLKKQCWSTCMR